MNTLFTKMAEFFGMGKDDAQEEERDSVSMDAADEALLKKFNSTLDRELKNRKTVFDNYKRWRDAVRMGEQWQADHDELTINPYFIFSTLSALLPNIYAKNPEVEVAPTQQAGESSAYDNTRAMADTAEALLNKEFVQSGLKNSLKSNVMSALVTGVGWMKLSLQEEYGQDPVLMSRLRDAQDNLAKLEALRDEIEDDPSNEEKQAQLKAQIQSIEFSLQGQGEIVLQKGLVVDRIPSEDLLILDPTLTDLGNYRQAKRIAQRVWVTKTDYHALFGHELPDGSATFSNRLVETSEASQGQFEDKEREALVQVWEVWDSDSQTVYTFAKGAKSWARAPYQPNWCGERWYPFFCLWFNEVDGSLDPISDVQTQYDLQEEYAHIRSKIRDVRKSQKTTMVARKGGEMESTDYKRIATGDDLDIVFVGGNPNIPINQDLQQAPSPQINLQLFDPAMLMRDSEMALRSGDAARGYINKAKTATEAEIMNMGLQSFTAERQDTLEDMINEMAQYALEIMLIKYDEAEVRQIVGEQAVWQKLPLESLFKYLSINVRSGSMSKPNKFKDREQWMQLLPVLQGAVQQIAQYQMQGQLGMVEVTKKLIEETLKRFDERLDLEQFMPQMMPQPQLSPQLGAMNGQQ